MDAAKSGRGEGGGRACHAAAEGVSCLPHWRAEQERGREREREGEGGVALALLGKGRGRATTSRGRVLGTIK